MMRADHRSPTSSILPSPKESWMLRYLCFSWLLVAGSWLSRPAQAAPGTRLAEEKLVLRTIAGDLVLGLYPDIAPKHVAQLIRLVEAGIFDGTHFYRLHPGFVLQTSLASDRLTPLAPHQSACIAPLPAEFSTLPHIRGTLSMAHEDGKPDSGETSFSILLGDAPHLDRNYTIFGELLEGWDVIDEFLKVPSEAYQPAMRLTIQSAFVSRVPLSELQAERQPATSIEIPPGLLSSMQLSRSWDTVGADAASPWLPVAIVGLLTVLLLNVVVCLTLWYASSIRLGLSLLLISTLVGYVVFIMLATPLGRREPWIGLGILIGLIAQFKLMSLFDRIERPR
jgi:cyclophilin family peptidyl-prolyl cis-trans isomerase